MKDDVYEMFMARLHERPAMPWISEAACRGMGAELFFPNRGGDVASPKAVCAQCPVQPQCKEYGEEHERFGIWGGNSGAEIREIHHKRKIRFAA